MSIKDKVTLRLSIEEAGYVHSILSDSQNLMAEDIRGKIQRAIYKEEEK